MANKEKKKNGFTGHVLNLVSGTVIAQTITLITAPIICRLFPPEAFGTCSVFVAITSLLGVIVCLRFDYAVVLPERDEEAINLMAVSLVAAIVVSGMGGFLIWMGKAPLVRWLKSPELGPYLWIVPVALLIQGLFQSLNAFNSRRKYFARLSVARVAASLTTSTVPIGMSAMGQSSPGALIWSWFAGTVVFTLTLGIKIAEEICEDIRKFVRLDRMLLGVKHYWRFPLIDVWGGFINNLSWLLPTLVFSAFFSQTIVGYYSLANRVVLMPMILIGDAIARIFFQRTAELRSKPDDLSKTVQRVFRTLSCLGFLPALSLVIIGPELFTVVFGANWIEAGKYAQILGIWMFFLFIASPMSPLFMVLGRQELSLTIHFSIFITRIIALVSGGLTNNIYLTLWLWSGTGILVYGGMAFCIMNLARIPYSFVFQTLLRYLLYSIPIALALLLAKSLFKQSPRLILMASVVPSMVYYFILLSRENRLSAMDFLPWRTSN